jgi:hypothetical protein
LQDTAVLPVSVPREPVLRKPVFLIWRVMVNSLRLEIAGVNFDVSCRDSMVIQEFPPVYLPFLKDINSVTGNDTIDVVLELDHVPDTSGMTRIFDTGESWSMFLHDGEYYMALDPPVLKKQIVWLARFDRGFRKATIYCSDMLIRRTEEGIAKVLSPLAYPFDQLFLMYILSSMKGALVHAAGIALKGGGYLFPGRSGAGKSTLVRQFAAKQRGDLLSDDRIVVRKAGGTFRAYGTPWPGDASVAANESVPLSGIFFISHGGDNLLRDLSRKEALERLLPLTSIPWYDRGVMTEILDFCDDLCLHVPAYELCFRPDGEVVNTLEEFVSK